MDPAAWLPTAAPALLAPRELVIWTTSYGIDSALARWRGAHPRVPLTRRVIPSEQLQLWLSEALRGERPPPDAVITDATFIGEWQPRQIWRQLDVSPNTDRLHTSVGLQQSTDMNGVRFAIPLTVNPIGAWYAKDLLATFLPDARPEAVATAFGTTVDSFQTFLAQAANALPIGPFLSSTLDDFVLPALDHAIQHDVNMSAEWQNAVLTAGRQTEAQQHSGAERHFSGNWYQGIMHEHTGLIIAGRWMQSALMRAVGDAPSSWRLTQPAGGFIAGPSLVCAIPERSVQPEAAVALATDLSTDADAQLLLCADTGTVPTLLQAHQSGPFIGTDAFCGGQEVGAVWCNAARTLTTVPLSVERMDKRRSLRDTFVEAFSRA
jgi:ABC-type glycerol-3-phosphate transport system substrate-binding protein